MGQGHDKQFNDSKQGHLRSIRSQRDDLVAGHHCQQLSRGNSSDVYY